VETQVVRLRSMPNANVARIEEWANARSAARADSALTEAGKVERTTANALLTAAARLGSDHGARIQLAAHTPTDPIEPTEKRSSTGRLGDPVEGYQVMSQEAAQGSLGQPVGGDQASTPHTPTWTANSDALTRHGTAAPTDSDYQTWRRAGDAAAENESEHPMAAGFLSTYLAGKGTTTPLPADEALKDPAAAQLVWGQNQDIAYAAVQEAKRLLADGALPDGPISFPVNGPWTDLTPNPATHPDLSATAANLSVATTGQVTVERLDDGGFKVTLDTRAQVNTLYDGTGAGRLFGLSDAELSRLNETGLARPFVGTGRSEPFHWTINYPPQ
jgi:hypothetical protein